MSKVLCIPDIHGNSKTIDKAIRLYDEHKPNVVIWLGDGFDSRTGVPFQNQKQQMQRLFDWKHSVGSNFYTLIGNHDLSYLTRYGADPCVSNHQFEYQDEIQEFLIENYDEFLAAKLIDNWLFSHAGVSFSWAAKIIRITENANIDERINSVFKSKKLELFNHCSSDPYGDHPSESCVWIRPTAFLRDGLPFNQCVGHTPLDNSQMCYWNLDSRIVYINEYYRQFGDVHRPKNANCIYVLTDSPSNDVITIIDTQTNEIKLL